MTGRGDRWTTGKENLQFLQEEQAFRLYEKRRVPGCGKKKYQGNQGYGNSWELLPTRFD